MDLASSGQRMMLVMKAIKIWIENVFFGIGLDNFVKRTYWMTMNEYARQLVEFGIFGFASYVFFYFIFVKQFFEYNKRQKNKENKAEGAFLLAALIAFAFNSFSMESYFHYIMWILPPLFFVFLDEKFICDNKL